MVGERLLDYQEVVQAFREATARAQAAETRLRQLEAEMNRLRGQS